MDSNKYSRIRGLKICKICKIRKNYFKDNKYMSKLFEINLAYYIDY